MEEANLDDRVIFPTPAVVPEVSRMTPPLHHVYLWNTTQQKLELLQDDTDQRGHRRPIPSYEGQEGRTKRQNARNPETIY